MERNTLTAIILLTLLSGCMPDIEKIETNHTRSTITPSLHLTTHPEIQRTQQIAFIASDNEKAARTVLRLGEELTLPLQTPLEITVESITETTATITLNNNTVQLTEGETHYGEGFSFYLATTWADTNE